MKRKDADTRSTASDAELVVMRVLWEYGPGTVHEVVARLGQRKRAWAYNTVLTFLRRLVVKGYVSSETKAVAFQFAPRITREELIALRLRELARDLADGALSEIAAILAREMQADSRSQRARRSRVARKRTGTANSKSARPVSARAGAARAVPAKAGTGGLARASGTSTQRRASNKRPRHQASSESRPSQAEVTRRDAGSVRMVAVDAGDAAVPAPHHLRVTTTRRSRRS